MGKRRVDQVSSENCCGDERNPQTKRFKLANLESQLETIYERDNEADSSEDSNMEKFEDSRFLVNLLLVSRPSNSRKSVDQREIRAENLDMGRRLSGLILTPAAHG